MFISQDKLASNSKGKEQHILNTVAPKGCVLSPLLYSLFTHDCMARYDSNTILKFTDDNSGRPGQQ